MRDDSTTHTLNQKHKNKDVAISTFNLLFHYELHYIAHTCIGDRRSPLLHRQIHRLPW